jgi:hypothetical protein
MRFVGFEFLTAVVMNVAIFWDTAPCSPHVNLQNIWFTCGYMALYPTRWQHLPFNLQLLQFTRLHLHVSSCNSTTGIAAGYGLNGRGSEFKSQYRREFSLLRSSQTGSGTHPPSYLPDTGDSFPRSKEARA